MRAHARAEDHIRRLKASGLERLPFSNLEANQAWLALRRRPGARWFQLLCLAGRLAAAEPKTLRWELWHTLRPGWCAALAGASCVLDTWPTTWHLLGAYQRLALIT